MAASVRHNLKLGISEFRCVASPAPARAFVPARGSQVNLRKTYADGQELAQSRIAGNKLKEDARHNENHPMLVGVYGSLQHQGCIPFQRVGAGFSLSAFCCCNFNSISDLGLLLHLCAGSFRTTSAVMVLCWAGDVRRRVMYQLAELLLGDRDDDRYVPQQTGQEGGGRRQNWLLQVSCQRRYETAT